MADSVDHPAHYGGEDSPYEVIKVAEAWGLDKDAYLFNVLKYVGRPGKGNYLEDLKKARFYLDRRITLLEGAHPEPESPPSPEYISISLKAFEPFLQYIVRNSMPNSVSKTLAEAVAEIAEARGLEGEYGITLSLEEPVTCFPGYSTIEWLARTYPPEHFTYYLAEKS